MPQIAPITVTYGINPIDYTVVFDPLGTEKGLTSYAGVVSADNNTTNVVTNLTTAPAMQPTCTISLSRPSKTSRISKVRLKVVMPVAALDLEGIPTNVKSHENSADITFLFSEKSSNEEREGLMYCIQYLQSDHFFDVITQLKSMY